MRNKLLFFFLTVSIIGGYAQDKTWYHYPNGIKFSTTNLSDTLLNPAFGGFNTPIFSQADLNGDGLGDLFVLDATTNDFKVFLNRGNSNFQYAPWYESLFPMLERWAVLVDYNKDGKPDIFSLGLGPSRYKVYKNISETQLPKFELVVNELLVEEIGFNTRMYAPQTDVPAVVDIDNDGDLDMLVFDVIGSYIQYYRNMSMERYGIPDSLEFRIEDRCFGKIAESPFSFELELNVSCGQVRNDPFTEGNTRAAHAGSCLLAMDLNGDNKKDLMLSDIDQATTSVVLASNTRFDSMVTVIKPWAPNGDTLRINTFPGLFAIDVDNNGFSDIISAPLTREVQPQDDNNIWYYKNLNTQSPNGFQLITKNFIKETGLDFGKASQPVFGRLTQPNTPSDMLVIALKDGRTIFNLFRYTNETYLLVDTNFNGLNGKLGVAKTAIFDINKDNLDDLILGFEDGTLKIYYGAEFQSNKLRLSSGITIPNVSVANYAHPCLADIDNDGLTDLLIGSGLGNIAYCRNIGTTANPSFELITENFGNIKTNTQYYEYIYDNQGKIIDSTIAFDPFGFAAPSIFYLPNSNTPNLIVGALDGTLSVYYDIGTQLKENDDFVSEKITINPIIAPSYTFVSNYNATPTIISHPRLEGEMVLFSGGFLGGLQIISTQKQDFSSLKSVLSTNTIGLKVYPNPAIDRIYVDLKEDPISIQVYTTSGKLKLESKNQEIDITSLKSGIYILKVYTTKGVGTQKFIKN